MADEQLLETGNVGFWDHEQTASVRDEIMIGENDGSALVPVKEDLGLHAVQTELDRNVDRFDIRLGHHGA